jgi:hypothetical protein
VEKQTLDVCFHRTLPLPYANITKQLSTLSIHTDEGVLFAQEGKKQFSPREQAKNITNYINSIQSVVVFSTFNFNSIRST